VFDERANRSEDEKYAMSHKGGFPNMDKNTRWVVLGYVGIGLVLAWVLSQGLQWSFYRLRDYGLRDIELLGSNFTLAHAVAFGLTAAVGFYLWNHERLNRGGHEVVEELRKVTWPDAQDTQTSTIVVLITTVIIALVLWVFDFIWSWGTTLIYGTGQS
jgi:preprotein translocase SecE subunit